ncbi:MAG: NAD(P)H-binding protein [Myxococcota bacterium]|mgnify:CR=1 FL=1|nr:hypothetical protein [Deltaproteobacteria bacterium]MCP4242430.1 NAD(P)H-binding protein [bacterium]MDP6075745.1 NAD(P)H-binding protein [Myxococcota bacterium]MBT40592.1 hypothetical protein [Deltaproteobacteria bacterium]MDP7075490.1 NAD(P)H-binding protein [Myxococcota bacterium]
MPQETGPVLVTGANGHLGRRLLRRLSGSRPLRPVVRSERAAEQISALDLPDPPPISILDYGDAAALTQAASGCSHAVHLAGILKENSSSRYADAHERASLALANASDAAGLSRIVYLSILGSSQDSANACLASKGRAEQILMAARTPTLVLRVPMVLGEGDFASLALGRRARARATALTRGGTCLEQPIYAGDVVDAIVAGTTRDGLDDLALDLAGPESLPQHQLVARAAAAAGADGPTTLAVPYALNHALAWIFEKLVDDPPVTRPMLGVLDCDDQVDPSEALAKLGIESTSLDEMLHRCVGLGAGR